MFRGREQSRPDLGYRLLQRLATDVEELGFVESAPKQDGRNMIMVIGPHKRKPDSKAERPAVPSKAERPAAPSRAERPAAPAVPAAAAAPRPAPRASAPSGPAGRPVPSPRGPRPVASPQQVAAAGSAEHNPADAQTGS
jgi:hypothetical protein